MPDIYARQKKLAKQKAAATAGVVVTDAGGAISDEFIANNVRLSNGQYVNKELFYSLSKDDQELLRKLGVDGFNKYYADKKIEFESNNIKLDTDEYVSREYYNQLSAENKEKLNSIGVAKFNDYIKSQIAAFELNNVKLSTGEYVDKAQYNNLPADWQRKLNDVGVSNFQSWLPSAYAGAKKYIIVNNRVYGVTSSIENYPYPDTDNIAVDALGNRVWVGGRWPDSVTGDDMGVKSITGRWPESVSSFQPVTPATHIKLDTGEWITKTQYIDAGKIDVTAQKVLKTQGTEAYKSFIKADKADIVKTKDNQLIAKDQLAFLAPKYQEIIKNKGYNEYIKQLNQDTLLLPSGERVNKDAWQQLPAKMKQAASKDGLQAIDISDLKPDAQFSIMQSWELIDKDARFAGVNDDGEIMVTYKDKATTAAPSEQWYKKYLNKQFLKGVGVGMIPIAGTIHHWEGNKAWVNGISIALDVLTFLPIVGGISAGVRAGGKIGAVVGRVALAELKAPITSVLHPVRTTKELIYPVETLVRGKKIPLTALEIRSESTIRIPVKDIGKATDAMQARDAITRAAILGDKPVINIAGRDVELSKVALQQKIKPAAVHSTPDITPFLQGVKVTPGREGGLFIAPSLHTRFTRASAFGDIPKDGIPGAIIIRDKQVLAKMQPSGKIYRDTAEIEKVIPGGIDLPAPSQVLITRDISGRKLHLAIIGDKLSKSEIARLKFMGSADLVKDIFRPALKIKGKGVKDVDDLIDMGRDARRIESELKTAKKAKNTTKIKELERQLDDINREFRDITRRVDAQLAGRTSLRPVALSTGDFIDRISYRDMARRNPKVLAERLAGIPRADQTRVLNDLDAPLRNRVNREINKIPANLRLIGRRNTDDGVNTITPYRGTGLPDRDITAVGRTRRPAVTPDRLVTTITPTPTKTTKIIPPTYRPDERIPPEKPPTSIVVKDKDGNEKRLTSKQVAGAVGWKQGFNYRLWYPPFGDDDVFNSPQPIAGIKYHKGVGSAARSIVEIYGELPATIKRDMGIVDVVVTPPGSGEKRPKIEFISDPKQSTKYSGDVKKLKRARVKT